MRKTQTQYPQKVKVWSGITGQHIIGKLSKLICKRSRQHISILHWLEHINRNIPLEEEVILSA